MFAAANSGEPNLPPALITPDSLEGLRKQGHQPHVISELGRALSGDLMLSYNSAATANYAVHNLFIAQCVACSKLSLWKREEMIYPGATFGPEPNEDLSDDIKHDFQEARDIAVHSPRGAAALLRLCIQKLMRAVGESGRDIDSDIAKLVAKGLPPRVQKSLDIVRVIGNEAVHPGVLDLADDIHTVETLFGLLNSIADQLISHPAAIDRMYEALPEAKRIAIEARNAKAKNTPKIE
ncbi:hypothetical protein FHW12_002937 [Dokdonella fugitiva]|uniref:DUF4145 domain-containing protein n=1 Tax=Dokdonella fugitiva TaxID=328517 RepID=A0A839F977_9GAMM|nr:DUF4145 domain-containing protein [Dokdonella fugitiva]MBA8888704.1 hypothetical protein [Dokdonella fugitiva]